MRYYGNEYKLIDIFGRPLNTGDFVLFSLYPDNFYDEVLDEFHNRVCVYQIVDNNCGLRDRFGEAVEASEYLELPIFMKEGIYVYKMELGDIEKEVLKESCDITAYCEKVNLSSNLYELFNRDGSSGDLVVYIDNHGVHHSLKDAKYGILVGDSEIYNGEQVEVSFFYYIISKMTDEEVKRREKLMFDYMKHSIERIKRGEVKADELLQH